MWTPNVIYVILNTRLAKNKKENQTNPNKYWYRNLQSRAICFSEESLFETKTCQPLKFLSCPPLPLHNENKGEK